MATRKTNKKVNKKSQGPKPIVVFWLVFIIVIISIFMVNAQTINKNFDLFKTRLTTSPGAVDDIPDLPILTETPPPLVVAPIQPRPSTESTQRPATTPAPQTEQRPATPTQPSAATPAPTPAATTQPPAQQQRPPAAAQPQPPAPAVQTRDRNVYYTQIDKDGQILQSRTSRKIPVSESPMVDTLNILLAGPSAEELARGTVNLIPQSTRIISATVRGNTAYINFSEDFLFNTFGVEGYVAQLRQIVWTVTEFPNVRDVQILIEGRRLDYLGEGIWIGSPISRQSF